MKTLRLSFIMIGFASILMVACQTTSTELPEDVTELKALQKEKKAALRELEKEIGDIQNKIAEIDPESVEVVTKLVTIDTASVSNFKRYIPIQSELKADETAYASSETGGTILSVFVEEGDYVSRGKLIARVDMESLRKQKEEVEKALELAVDVYERQKRLWDQNIGSELQYIQAKNQKESLEKSIETINYRLSKARVLAPISGEVSMVMKEAGEVAGPGEPVVQILKTNELVVEASVPENLLSAVAVGDDVKINVPSLSREYTLPVTHIGSVIDQQNRTFKVEVDLPNRDKTLKPNLLADVYINDFSADSVIVVPTNVVQQEVSGKYYIYVAARDAGQWKVVKRFVTTAESYDNHIIVKDGIQAGDLIISKGSRNVTPGTIVKIISDDEQGKIQPEKPASVNVNAG